MKKHLFLLLLCCGMLAACHHSGTEKDETEAVPAEANAGKGNDEDDMPRTPTAVTADSRLQVSMENVGVSEDTVASMISGYIDTHNTPVPATGMQLWLRTVPQTKGRTSVGANYKIKIEPDGRVPGTWVSPDADCYFMLIVAKDTMRFETKVEQALYRFKVEFKAKV